MTRKLRKRTGRRQQAASKRASTQPAKASRSARKLAERYGSFVRHAALGGQWFGPNGGAPGLAPIPVEFAAKWGRLAGRYALEHRARYPLGRKTARKEA